MKPRLLALAGMLVELAAILVMVLALVAMFPSLANAGERGQQRVQAPLDYAQRSLDKTVVHSRRFTQSYSAPAGSGTRHVYQPTRDHQRGNLRNGRLDRQDHSRGRR